MTRIGIGRRDAAIARLAATLMVIVLAGACTQTGRGPASSSPVEPQVSPDVTPVEVTPSPAPASEPTPTLDPNAALTVGWEALGAIDPGDAHAIRMIGDGYAAWGQYGDAERPVRAAWYSPDGVEWSRTDLAQMVVPCDGRKERPDLTSMYAWPTDGRTTVIFAKVLVPGVCGRSALVALSTTDGRTWTRSEPFLEDGGEIVGAWASRDGWEILVRKGADGPTIWRSSDLDTWTEVGAPLSGDHEDWVDFSAVGTPYADERVGVVRGDDDGSQRVVLASSSDAATWVERLVIPEGFDVNQVVPPMEAGRPWLVTIERYGGDEEGRVLVSTDLDRWTSTTLAKPYLAEVVPHARGWAGIGMVPDFSTGCLEDCGPHDVSILTSTDGLTWIDQGAPMPLDPLPALSADGFGGILTTVEEASPGRLVIK